MAPIQRGAKDGYRRIAKYTWMECERNEDIFKQLKIEIMLDKIL
jgi:hypothetical protein